METTSKSIVLGASYETHNGYTPLTAWYVRDIRDDARKELVLDNEPIKENNSIWLFRGKRYRLWEYTKPKPNQPWAQCKVGIRERPGLVTVLEGTPKTVAGFNQLMAQESQRLVKGATDPSLNLYLVRGTRRGAKIYGANVEWLTMSPRKVGYYGITDEPATLELQWGFAAERLRRRTELRFSPVRTETETKPVGLHNECVPHLHGRVDASVSVVYKFADGTRSAALEGALYTDRWHEDKLKWVAQCQEEWVLTKVKGSLRNGEYTVDPEMGRNRNTEPVLAVRGLSALSTKAGRETTHRPSFERIIAQRLELKEALAMAVFAPARVERMMETYGEDWMERV